MVLSPPTPPSFNKHVARILAAKYKSIGGASLHPRGLARGLAVMSDME